ncbi:MAG: hypothetical protein H0V07_02030 [Propionibacteriales bacterium]|nr:hypothetical protein [Propionibacteriales bacterium]
MLGTLLRAGDLGPVVRFRLAAAVPIRTYGVYSPEGAGRLLVGAAQDYRRTGPARRPGATSTPSSMG